jgi:hypothetical protein
MTVISLLATMAAIVIVAFSSLVKGFSGSKVSKTSKKIEKVIK